MSAPCRQLMLSAPVSLEGLYSVVMIWRNEEGLQAKFKVHFKLWFSVFAKVRSN